VHVASNILWRRICSASDKTWTECDDYTSKHELCTTLFKEIWIKQKTI